MLSKKTRKKEDLHEKNTNEKVVDEKSGGESVEDNDLNIDNDFKNTDDELSKLAAELKEKNQKCEEYYAMAQRIAAEFDNYKKRNARERESLYEEAMAETIEAYLPVIDNLERAFNASQTAESVDSVKDGIDLVLRQFKDVLKKQGVEEIKSLGELFDHNLHNAVMHVEDESASENTVVEEFQKGYKLKDRVIRHSMVKVAN